ncbi:hypothetical protein MPSEU_000011900 [Mayamaea pseudoterrestris]|nr:hypothetical protein MPSEU_000011900 [Mayamaea pseudoterrestris]
MRLLPENFYPGNYDVILGRGQRIFLHQGNKFFRRLVLNNLPEYSSSTSKLDKSIILRNIIAQVRSNSVNGGFVKRDAKSGRWYEIGDFLARERTSQAFRDALYERYKSSNTSKRLRRLHEQDSHLLLRATSGTGLAEGRLQCHERSSSVHSCPSLGKVSHHYDGFSLRNFEWDISTVPGDKVADETGNSRALLARKSRMPSPHAILDFPFQKRKDINFDTEFLPLIDQYSDLLGDLKASAVMMPLMHQVSDVPLASPSESLASCIDAPLTALGSSYMTTRDAYAPTQDVDIFDRLVDVVGEISIEGDPYNPIPWL